MRCLSIFAAIEPFHFNWSKKILRLPWLSIKFPLRLITYKLFRSQPTIKSDFENFLQLPSSLPERVKNLANELTDGLATPIEKVKAIEDHLKSLGNYRYSKIDAQHTPENRDYVDYFYLIRK